MRPFVVFLLTSLLVAISARAQSTDPSELFLNAYLSVQQGEKLERSDNYEEALAKYRYAGSLLDQVATRHKDWQPLIVDYRRQKTAEAIRRLEDKMAIEGTAAESAIPNLEGPLPSADLPLAPSVSTTPGRPVEETTSAIGSRLSELQRELEQSRQEMSMLQRDKRELTQRLDEALKRADRAQVTEAELRSQLQQARDALQNALSDQSSGSQDVTKLRKQISDLTAALEAARAERDAADDLAGNLTAQQKELRQQLSQAQEDLKKAKEAGENPKAVKELEKQVAQLRDALQEARAERDAADEVSGSLRGRLLAERTQSQETIASITAERDQAVASLESFKKSQADVAALMAEKEDLTTKLAEAEKRISEFNTEIPKKDAEIASLRGEIERTKTELEQAQKQSGEYKTAMLDLQNKLDELRANADAGLTRENEVLRGIVLRQLKEQARRDQAKKLVLAELAKLEVKSDSLMQQVEYLGQPVTRLTPEERALFKAPQIEILDVEEPSSMAISIAAPKTGEVAPAPAAGSSLTDMASLELPKPFEQPIPEASPSPGGLFGEEPTPAPQVETSTLPNVPGELLPVARQARENFERGEFREAEKLYEKILSAEPNNLYALSNLGVARFRGGKLRLAEEAFKKALAINPDDAFSHRTLGIVFYSEGKHDDAIDELTKALAVNPKDAIAHNYLGIAASQKGWPEAAQKEMETAIALDPNYADAHFNLAVIHISARPPRKEQAREHYRRAVELGSDPDPTLEEMLK